MVIFYSNDCSLLTIMEDKAQKALKICFNKVAKKHAQNCPFIGIEMWNLKSAWL
jgi:hypothetical protein